jgi:hypothetical protein
MGFTMQGAGPILHWFTLVILCVFPVIGAIVLYKLGGLPGSIAAARGHPQAAAINVCGWMGIITLVLWPIALVWAYLSPGNPASTGAAGTGTVAHDDMNALLADLRRASQRVAALEGRLSARRVQGGARQ